MKPKKSEDLKFKELSTKAEEGLPTSDFWLPTSDFRLPTSDFRLPTSDFRLPTSDFRLPTSDFRLPTSKFKASIFDVQLISPEIESNLIKSESYKLLSLRIVAWWRMRAARVILQANWEVKWSLLLETLKRDQLSLRRRERKAIMMFKSLNGLAQVYLRELFSERLWLAWFFP